MSEAAGGGNRIMSCDKQSYLWFNCHYLISKYIHCGAHCGARCRRWDWNTVVYIYGRVVQEARITGTHSRQVTKTIGTTTVNTM